MKSFDTVNIAITPLTPVHIGCSEDFEPTNYTIDRENQTLFAFDPSRAILNDTQRSQLKYAAQRADLLSIQKFFRDNAETFIGYANQAIPVTAEVSRQYHKQLGKPTQTIKDGNNIINQMVINRTAYHSITGIPYLPGSSLKGAIRTAILDTINNGQIPTIDAKQANQWENKLLGISNNNFSQSIFRLLKISDCIAESPNHQIVMARQYKKKISPNNQNNSSIPTRKEIIQPAQYRAFRGEITLQSLANTKYNVKKDLPTRQLDNISIIARNCNLYYRKHFERSLSTLRNLLSVKLISEKWLKTLEALYFSLKEKLDSNTAFLLQLGQYGGAESKTYSDVARIKIMHGKKLPPTIESTTTTIWLTDCGNGTSNQPFGWILVEINPEKDIPTLKQWCVQQQAIFPNIEIIKQKLSALKQAVEEKKAALAKQQAEKKAKRLAEEAEAKLKAKELAAMPIGKRIGIELSTLLNNVKIKDVGASVIAEVKKQLENSIATLQKEDRINCIATVKSTFKKKDLLSKKNKDFFKNIENL